MLINNDLGLYFCAGTPINLGMQTIIHDIPDYLTTLIETLRAKLRVPLQGNH